MHPFLFTVGQKYVPLTTTRKPYTTALPTVTEEIKTEAITPITSQISLITAHEVAFEETYYDITSVTEGTQISLVKPSDEECYCEYPINDENLIAHADGKRLKFHDKIKNGSAVILRCKHVGFHHLNGEKYIKCKNCRNWHSSEFPTCNEPRRGKNIFFLWFKIINLLLL